MRTPRSLAPLRHRRFRLLVTGQLASNVGDLAYAVALPWYVLAHHGGPVLLGIALAAYGVPRTALLAVGGSASDRFRPWNVMMVADTVRTIGVALLAVVAARGPADAAVLVPIAAVLGACEGLFMPASFAIIPELLPGESLQAGNALSQGGTQLANLLGPALGGLLVATVGPVAGFAVDAASFAISALTLLLIGRSSLAVHGDRASEADENTAAPEQPTLRRVFATEPVLWVIAGVTIAANLGLGGLSDVALPDLAHQVLASGAGGYGLLLACFGVGGLAGAALAAHLTPKRPALTASGLFGLAAAAIILVPVTRTELGAALALAVLGVTLVVGNVIMLTVVQRWVDPALMGRLMGAMMFASLGTFPVSVLAAGLVVKEFGPASFFEIAGAILGAALLGGLTSRRWRAFGTAPSPTTGDAVGTAD